MKGMETSTILTTSTPRTPTRVTASNPDAESGHVISVGKREVDSDWPTTVDLMSTHPVNVTDIPTPPRSLSRTDNFSPRGVKSEIIELGDVVKNENSLENSTSSSSQRREHQSDHHLAKSPSRASFTAAAARGYKFAWDEMSEVLLGVFLTLANSLSYTHSLPYTHFLPS